MRQQRSLIIAGPHFAPVGDRVAIAAAERAAVMDARRLLACQRGRSRAVFSISLQISLNALSVRCEHNTKILKLGTYRKGRMGKEFKTRRWPGDACILYIPRTGKALRAFLPAYVKIIL